MPQFADCGLEAAAAEAKNDVQTPKKRKSVEIIEIGSPTPSPKKRKGSNTVSEQNITSQKKRRGYHDEEIDSASPSPNKRGSEVSEKSTSSSKKRRSSEEFERLATSPKKRNGMYFSKPLLAPSQLTAICNCKRGGWYDIPLQCLHRLCADFNSISQHKEQSDKQSS